MKQEKVFTPEELLALVMKKTGLPLEVLWELVFNLNGDKGLVMHAFNDLMNGCNYSIVTDVYCKGRIALQ